jgi:hypothetical protein
MKAIESRDAKTRITKYLTDGDVTLSAAEESILMRWEHCDLLMRQKKLTYDEMVERIALRYAVSKYTAQSDFAAAQEVFALSRKANKKYLLHLHAQRIDKVIEQYVSKVVGENLNPDSKEVLAIARLSDSYTKAIEAMPSDHSGKETPPPILLFNLVKGDQIVSTIDPIDALSMAKRMVEDQDAADAEDIEHEEI